MKKLLLISILVSIISAIFIHIYAFNRTAIYIDTIYHFFDMKQYHESKTFPVVGNRLMNNDNVRDNNIYARIPGGFYYVLYLLCYNLGLETLVGARIIYIIFCSIILLLFFIWVYKKFSLTITAILSALILTNGYVIFSSNDFWNPNIPLMFSFLLFIVFSEYVSNENDNIVFLSAIFIFPIEALMAQGHIAVFFSIVPTTIIYLIIKYKKTFKYIKAHLIGVFVSFLSYLPYLVSEIRNGFFNTNLMLNMQSGTKFIGLPQVYSILIFPTNEISVLYGTNPNPIKYFWFNENIFFIGMIFLAITAVLSLFAFIYSVIFLIKNRKNNSSNMIILEKELFIFYLLFIPATCFTFVILKSTPGTFRYLYGIFAFSFVPIIILFNEFFKDTRRQRLLLITTTLLILNTVNMGFLHMKRYYDLFEAPYTEAKFKNIMESISKDANGKPFKIIPYDDLYFNNMNFAYFTELEWYRDDDNAELVYFIYYEIENVRLKNTGKHKNYDELLNKLPSDAVLLAGDDKLKVYRYSI